MSFSHSWLLVLHSVSRESCNLYRCFWYLVAVCCHKATIAHSLLECEGLMREACASDNRALQEAPHSDNAPKFKGTVVLDGESLLYTINWRN